MVDPDDFIYRHHDEPRVHLYVPEEETFRIPLKYIDVIRSTHTDLDVLQEKRDDDYWNVDLNRSLSDSWKGFVKCSSGMSHVPSQPSRVPSPKGMISSDSCLSHNTRRSWGTSRNVFWRSTCSRRAISIILRESKEFDIIFFRIETSNTRNTMRHGEGLRREPQSSTKPTPRCTRKYKTWNPLYHIEGTYSRNCMMEVWRYAISELHLGKFPDPDDFQCWRVNFKAEECVSTPFPRLTMSWIAEVSIDDLMT